MTQYQKLTKRGFTIIEVLIVLAIAGLIMLIVFLAVPALQRNSRNNERRNDAAKLAASISEFIVNHGNTMPVASNAAEIEANANLGFLTEVSLGVNNNPVGTTNPDVNRGYIKIAAKCNVAGDNAGGSGPTARNAAVVYFVETTGDPKGICLQVQ